MIGITTPQASTTRVGHGRETLDPKALASTPDRTTVAGVEQERCEPGAHVPLSHAIRPPRDSRMTASRPQPVFSRLMGFSAGTSVPREGDNGFAFSTEPCGTGSRYDKGGDAIATRRRADRTALLIGSYPGSLATGWRQPVESRGGKGVNHRAMLVRTKRKASAPTPAHSEFFILLLSRLKQNAQ